MSDLLEHCLDATMNMRERSRRQHEAELDLKERAVRGSHAELERRRMRFCTEVQSLIQTAAERANRHLATRPERCEFCEVSEHSDQPVVSWWPDLQSDCLQLAGGWSGSWGGAHCRVDATRHD